MSLTTLPRLSEKSYNLSKNQTYIFVVEPSANKLEIKKSIEAGYEGVKVKSVRTSLNKGKAKRWYRKGGSSVLSARSDYKMAYVSLLSGSIPMFDGFEEEEKTEEKAKKADPKIISKTTAKTTVDEPAKKRLGFLRRGKDTSKTGGNTQVRRVQNKSGDA